MPKPCNLKTAKTQKFESYSTPYELFTADASGASLRRDASALGGMNRLRSLISLRFRFSARASPGPTPLQLLDHFLPSFRSHPNDTSGHCWAASNLEHRKVGWARVRQRQLGPFQLE
jgi:hypothetical protein